MNDIVVACPNPDCAFEYLVEHRLAWRRVRCPECDSQGAAILASVRNEMCTQRERAPMPTLTPNSVVAVLEDLRSIHNVGSILRTCDAFGVDLVVMTGVTPTPDHQKIKKAALGAELSVPWVWRTNAVAAVTELEEQKIQVAALEESNSASDLQCFRLTKPFSLVVGNEVAGVSSPVLDRAAKHVSIPMLGTKTSLNAAVAFGIALWHIINVGHTAHEHHSDQNHASD